MANETDPSGETFTYYRCDPTSGGGGGPASVWQFDSCEDRVVNSRPSDTCTAVSGCPSNYTDFEGCVGIDGGQTPGTEEPLNKAPTGSACANVGATFKYWSSTQDYFQPSGTRHFIGTQYKCVSTGGG